MTMVILLGGDKMKYIFTFNLWDGRKVDIESRLMKWAMEDAMKQDIFLDAIESIKVREKCYD